MLPGFPCIELRKRQLIFTPLFAAVAVTVAVFVVAEHIAGIQGSMLVTMGSQAAMCSPTTS